MPITVLRQNHSPRNCHLPKWQKLPRIKSIWTSFCNPQFAFQVNDNKVNVFQTTNIQKISAIFIRFSFHFFQISQISHLRIRLFVPAGDGFSSQILVKASSRMTHLLLQTQMFKYCPTRFVVTFANPSVKNFSTSNPLVENIRAPWIAHRHSFCVNVEYSKDHFDCRFWNEHYSNRLYIIDGRMIFQEIVWMEFPGNIHTVRSKIGLTQFDSFVKQSKSIDWNFSSSHLSFIEFPHGKWWKRKAQWNYNNGLEQLLIVSLSNAFINLQSLSTQSNVPSFCRLLQIHHS